MREGAVTELGRLLGAHDPGLAESAREALERLTDDDSRRVGAAATAALTVAAPEPTALGAGACHCRGRAASRSGAAPDSSRRGARSGAGPQSARRGAGRRGPFRPRPLGAARPRPWRARSWCSRACTVFASQPWEPSLNVAGMRHGAGRRRRCVGVGVTDRGCRGARAPRGRARAGRLPDRARSGRGGLKRAGTASTSPRGRSPLAGCCCWRARCGGGAGSSARARASSRSSWSRASSCFSSPSFAWFYDSPGIDQLLWPITLALSIAALVAVGSVAVGLWRGGRAWAALLAAAPAGSRCSEPRRSSSTSRARAPRRTAGCWLAFVTGLLLSAAGVFAHVAGRLDRERVGVRLRRLGRRRLRVRPGRASRRAWRWSTRVPRAAAPPRAPR